jgi:hypothetical protein
VVNVAKYKIGDVVELDYASTTGIGIILDVFQISADFNDNEERYTRIEYQVLIQGIPHQPLWLFESEIIKKLG